MEEFFDMAKAMAFMPPARGNRIAILTDGGGCGVMATDAAELVGLKVVETPPDTLQRLKELVERKVIPPFAALRNPIDLTGSATNASYEEALRVLLESPGFDGVVLILLHHVPGVTWDLPERLAKIVWEYRKPVTACDVGMTEMAVYTRKVLDEHFIPSYPSPERAVRAMRALVEYGAFLKREGVLDEYLEQWTPPAKTSK